MVRLDLHFADELFCYQTHLTVRITDINAANHLANDSMISMISALVGIQFFNLDHCPFGPQIVSMVVEGGLTHTDQRCNLLE